MATALTVSGALLLALALGASATDRLLLSATSSSVQVQPPPGAAEAPALQNATAGAPPDEHSSTPGRARPATPLDARPRVASTQATSQQEPTPVATRIPAIQVDVPLLPLGLTAGGQLEAPETGDVAGWFADGPEPGEPGAAVIAGHVDSLDGPGVFWDLGELIPGDDVFVRRTDGSEARFVVTDVGRWPKDDFPTDAVYQRDGPPLLRLVTCGGEWDDQRNSYRDNVIVFAEMAQALP